MNKPEWAALTDHKSQVADKRIKQLFEADSNRFDKFSLQVENILFDYSKNLITDETLDLLLQLLNASGFDNWRDRFFMGEHVNTTEKRAVQHMALRLPDEASVMVDGTDVMPDIVKSRKKLRKFSEAVRERNWTGHSGKAIEHIVHIGIGGSYLGPKMVTEALSRYHHPDLTCSFVSNVDGHEIDEVIRHFNPETTLFLIASKTFTTQETMMNALTARDWITGHFGSADAVAKHFVALSTNSQAVTEFGIDPENMFEFWDWVGGRYSLWSAIGAPIAIMIGMDRFEDLLEGANAMDQHFKTAPAKENLPVLLAMVGIWNRNFLEYPFYSVVTYDNRLELLPQWLQQTDMESNGKSVDRAGQKTDYVTGPMIMGGAVTDVQHSFFQWMHQGTDPTPVDFIICAKPDHKHPEHHQTLITHFLAQQQALMEGVTNTEEPHRNFPGNRPSNALILDSLTPYTLGQLLAAYEHKVFVQGIVWNINSFDQFGVELGKTMAKDLQTGWDMPDENYDSSTLGQLAHIKTHFSG